MNKERYLQIREKWLGLVRTRDDHSEIVSYDNPTFPCFAFDGYSTGVEPWLSKVHWHEDIEIMEVYAGRTLYNVNGNEIILEPGDTLFINSRRLHYETGVNNELCIYNLIVINPKVLCSSPEVESQYILPILNDPFFDYLVLKGGTIDTYKIHEICAAIVANKDNPFEITRYMFELWKYIIEAHRNQAGKRDEKAVFKIEELRDMICFIQDNYQSKIALEEIARVGNMSKSTCNNLFKKYTNYTPTEYLIRYRLDKATELLHKTSDSVATISAKCGFSTSSYMTEQFVKCLNTTPREIRKTM